ncbi:MAG: outer membrane beta-barrel protein [Cytophaga sp.]|uniref:outer membrane beta-barrel protein n=1 Tax=Cytophaga sp. TaxID=29535 RepID=UPI003F81CB5B
MKKLFIVFGFLLLTGIVANAQKAHFGFRVGASNTTYYGSDFSSVKDAASIQPIWKPTAGFYVNSEVSDYFWIKTEFNYVNRGYTHKEAGSTLKTNYYCIDVYPLTAAFHYKGAQIFAGPSVSLLVASQKDSLIAGQVKKINDNKLDGINRYDIGIMAGIEYEFNFGLNLGIRMVHGFTSLYEPVNNVQTQWFNQGYMFTLGYSIGKKPESSKE